jgi:predicted  nucleic acid-binding Zn-ribbon protein
MSQNNIPSRLPTIEKLITRINSAEKSNQKEIKLTMQESKDLVYELAILTSRLGTTVQEIHQMLLELRESTTKIDVKFDGGTF